MMESAVQAPSGVSGAHAANDNADAAWPIVTFSPAELAQLVRRRVLEPTRSSPIATLLRGNPGAALRNRAAGAALAEKGLSHRATHEPTSELGALLLLALRTLARPKARLIVARYAPHGEPSVLPLFLSGDLAVPAFLDEGGLHVGTPMERSILNDTLEFQLTGEGAPPMGDHFVLETSTLETIEGLWCGTGRSYDQPIPRELAVEVLAHLPEAEDGPDRRVEELLASGFVTEEDDGLRFTPAALPWMDRVLSGHSCELSFLPLEEAGTPARPLRLLFLGTAGHRVLCSGAEGLDDLETLLTRGRDHAVVAGPWTSPAPSTGDQTLTLSVLQPCVLRWYLRRLIHA